MPLISAKRQNVAKTFRNTEFVPDGLCISFPQNNAKPDKLWMLEK